MFCLGAVPPIAPPPRRAGLRRPRASPSERHGRRRLESVLLAKHSPRALPFFFADGTSVPQLVECFVASGGRGQIVGPHGSGKSALLAALIGVLEARDRDVVSIELHDGQRTLPSGFWASVPLTARSVLAIDGCEQLSWWQRHRALERVRRSGAALVVTTHRPLRLPLLYRTRPTADVAVHIAAKLQRDRPLIAEAEVRQAFAVHGGDLREMLFALYDIYAQRQHAAKR